jgi:DNA-binding NtrC family response regulator
MEKKVVVLVDTDKKQCQNLCALLTDHEYMPTPLTSLTNMDQYIEEIACRAIILNLDTVSVTNKIFRDLKRKNPLANIIAFSERQYHPELEEALRDYISVCLAKPVDPDELFYWLRCVFKNDEEMKAKTSL